jgi:hypothetical protein
VKKAPGDALDEGESFANWLPWALPVAGLLLLVALGLAVYQVLPDRKKNGGGGLANVTTDKTTTEQRTGLPITTGKTSDRIDPRQTGKQGGGGGSTEKPIKGNGGGTKGGNAKVEKEPVESPRILPPSKVRLNIGTYKGGFEEQPTVLLHRRADDRGFARVGKNDEISTADMLVTLPGFTSLLATNKGVNVMLRGSLREFVVSPPMTNLLESAVILHENNKFDLDLTLVRGRIYLRNNRAEGSCKVRLRLEEETWDLTLSDPGDEVCVDLTRTYTPILSAKRGDLPQTDGHLIVLRGQVNVTINGYDARSVEVKEPHFALMSYSSTRRTGKLEKYEAPPLPWYKVPPSVDQFPAETRQGLKEWEANVKRIQGALKNMETLLGARKSPKAALVEMRDKRDPAERVVAIYGLGAIDGLDQLIDALGDGDKSHRIDRETAFFVLRGWANRGPGQGKVIYETLINRNFKEKEAETIRDLMYPFPATQMRRPETFEYLVSRLQASKISIAEMAFNHLFWLSPGVALPVGFNAADGYDDRAAYARKIQLLIDDKKLPPPSGEGSKEQDKEKEKEK